jgi:hypothetical protein
MVGVGITFHKKSKIFVYRSLPDSPVPPMWVDPRVKGQIGRAGNNLPRKVSSARVQQE